MPWRACGWRISSGFQREDWQSRKCACPPQRQFLEGWRVSGRQTVPLEIESRWFLEMEGHGAFRNFDSAQQFGLITSYRDFVSSHAYSSTFGQCRPFI